MFLDEANELLNEYESLLLEFEKKKNKKILDELFRCVHSIKGEASALGFSKLVSVAHKAEDILAELRDGKKRISKKIMEYLFSTVDKMGNILAYIARDGGEENVSESMVEEVVEQAVLEQTSKKTGQESEFELSFTDFEKATLAEAVSKGKKLYLLKIKISPDAPMKYARAYMTYSDLEKMAEVYKTFPDIKSVTDDSQYNTFLCVVSTDDPEQLVSSLLVDEIEDIKVEPLNLENILEEEKAPEPVSDLAKVPISKSIRVDLERIDRVVDLVGELVISKERLAQLTELLLLEHRSAVANELGEIAGKITQTVDLLQIDIMKLRMQPIRLVFSKFPRMVRDYAEKFGKEIELVISGEDTEVDKTVVEVIGEPLTHIIRNAVDHGIEPPEEREKLGKPRVGRISLSAYQRGEDVFIEVADDGRGIDWRKIKEKAIEKKLISKEEADSMSPDEIIDFIFHPGFSTRDEAGELSGRGVGLDVVKDHVKQLGGDIEVVTEPGQYTIFRIRIPLTLAILNALLVKVEDGTYAFPLSTVYEVLKTSPDALTTLEGKQMVQIGENLFPLVSLRELFGFEEKQRAKLFIVVAGSAKRQYAFCVDELIGQQDILIKPLDPVLADSGFFSGVTVLGDGSVCFIINPEVVYGTAERG